MSSDRELQEENRRREKIRKQIRENDKFLELATAVNRVTTVWTAIDYILEDDVERQKWITTAMQYNAFLTGFSISQCRLL